MSKIRVLFIDDYTIINNHMKELLNTKENVEVVGVEEDVTQVIKMFSELLPDVIIDFKMPNLNDGFGETYMMKMINPEANIIIITAYTDAESRYQTFQSDVSDYLKFKKSAIIELISAIHTIAKRNKFISLKVYWIIVKRLKQT